MLMFDRDKAREFPEYEISNDLFHLLEESIEESKGGEEVNKVPVSFSVIMREDKKDVVYTFDDTFVYTTYPAHLTSLNDLILQSAKNAFANLVVASKLKDVVVHTDLYVQGAMRRANKGDEVTVIVYIVASTEFLNDHPEVLSRGVSKVSVESAVKSVNNEFRAAILNRFIMLEE